MDLGLPGPAARPTGSPRDRRAVAHSGWGSQACSLSVDVGAAAAARGEFFFANGGRRRRRWSSRMDLAPPGRAAAAATYGVAARAGPVDLYLVFLRARGPPPLAAPATAVADFLFGESRSRLEPGMDLGLPGRAARPMGSPRDRRAVAHSGWGSQACSLSVDVVQRQRHAAVLFREWRPAPAAMELEDGPRAAGASGRGGHLRGRGSSRPTLTFISILTRARPSAAGCAGDRCRRFSLWRIPEPAGAGDGPRAAGASGRPMGSPRDRRAVAHSGWGSQACSLSVDLGAAAAARGILFREWRPAPAAMELEDGPRAAGASGRGGDLRGRGPTAP